MKVTFIARLVRVVPHFIDVKGGEVHKDKIKSIRQSSGGGEERECSFAAAFGMSFMPKSMAVVARPVKENISDKKNQHLCKMKGPPLCVSLLKEFVSEIRQALA